jgi:hypothetical protein
MNRHLNIFHFFDDNDKKYLENNLSRAFALCLKNDAVFLDNVLKHVLPSNIYSDLFENDRPNYTIDIDLQKTVSSLDSYTNIIGIACSGIGIDLEDIEGIVPDGTPNPITDLCITIDETILVFEFKRTNEDCKEQLLGQVERIKENCPDDAEITVVDYNWREIIKTILKVLSFQKQINSVNSFTSDFADFLEYGYSEWFPNRLLKNISFPTSSSDPNKDFLARRLRQIVALVAKNIGYETNSYSGKYNRIAIETDWNWSKEIHLDFDVNRHNSITVSLFGGDTKNQGYSLYKSNKPISSLPDNINGHEIEFDPYMKFSHFNSTVTVCHLKNEEYKDTHLKSFFRNYAGRYKREKWSELETVLDGIVPKWKEGCSYNEKLENSNRSYFDFTVGLVLKLHINFNEIKNKDNDEENPEIIDSLTNIIVSLKQIVERNIIQE